MKSVEELNLGSVDAINYKTRDQKQFFSQILYREENLDRILQRNKYFLIGEKGTGKTSYAVFLNNTDYMETLSSIVSLTQTDYRRFVQLTENGSFSVSSYVDIWKVILLLLISENISQSFDASKLGFPKFNALKNVIDEYYHSAFRPEVAQSLDLIEHSDVAVGLMDKHVDKYGESKIENGRVSSFKVNLAFLERKFRESLASLKLNKNFILFIDGIDIRPDQIDYAPYIECIRGLANAAWELNTDFLSNIRDTRKHLKVVLLMRPDILDNMGFQNLNAKVRDNGVLLDWMTTYDSFSKSSLFKLVVGTLAKQQSVGNMSDLEVWNHYFPYDLDNLRLAGVVDNAFVGLLRYSFYRPRDIIQYLQLMQAYIAKHDSGKTHFTRDSFYKSQREFSDYLLGEVKDYLGFYYSTVDFDEVVGFFSHLGGKNSFSWDVFKSAFGKHKERLKGKDITIRELMSSPEEFLQFLYALNIIGYVEPEEFGGTFIHYCFRDRTTVKLRPKVRIGLSYQVHPGLQRALLVGGETRSRSNHRRQPKRLTNSTKVSSPKSAKR